MMKNRFKKIILMTGLLFSFLGFGQTEPPLSYLADAVKFRQTTTTIRNQYVVPSGQFWMIYNQTTSTLEYWNGSAWSPIGGSGSDDDITSATFDPGTGVLTINEGGTSIQVDLSALDTDTQLTQTQVGTFATNEGFIKTYTETDPTVNQTLIEALGFFVGPHTIDTNLTESEVDAFVANNGYLTLEVDGSITNEIQGLEEVLSEDNESDNIPIRLTDNANTRVGIYSDDFIRLQEGSQLAGQTGTAFSLNFDGINGNIGFFTEDASSASATLTEKFRLNKANTGFNQSVATFYGSVGIEPYYFNSDFAATVSQLTRIQLNGSNVSLNPNAFARTLNFTGAGVSISETLVTDDQEDYTITISGGGGGSESTTVADTPEIDLTMTGFEISATLVNNSIDESKLDASVNASLDLADSAIQSETDPTVDGSETIINPGSNVTISGNGTSGNPYIINSTGGSGGYVLAEPLSLNGSGSFTTTTSNQFSGSAKIINVITDNTSTTITLANADPLKMDYYSFDLDNANGEMNFLSVNGFVADGFVGNAVLLDGVGEVDFRETGINTGVFKVYPGSNVSYVTIDNTAPSVPTGLTAGSTTSTTADWTWTASTDNIGVTGYFVSLDDGAQIDVGNVLTYTATGLTASTSYDLKVRAYDAAGNNSSFTSNVPNTTSAGGGNPNLFAAGSVTDPDNEANTLNGWTATGGSVTIAVEGTEVLDGSYSIAVTQGAAGVDGATEVSTAIISFPPGTYDFRISRKGSANFTAMRSSIIFADTFTPFAQSIGAGDGTWQTLTHTETFAVTTNVRVYFRTSSGAANDAYTNNGNTPQTAYFDFVFARLQ